MMTKRKQLTFFTVIFILLIGCKPEIDKYKRPEWLVGKVYTQIKQQPQLSTFTECLDSTGYGKIIDVSGSYTVFAPSNDAFTKYFQENTKYKSVKDIPKSELTELVKYHIVQNPWSKNQLRTLDVNGWIDTLDINNNKPKGFKRETLLLKKDLKVGVFVDNNANYSIVDTLSTNWSRRIITDSRKFVPIFYKEYFEIYNLNSFDYEFYFNRSFDNSDIYYANAKIVGEEIFAENGFIYEIDEVVEPLKNGYEILNSSENTNSYSDFLRLINYFPRFYYNQDKTFNQPGADQGLTVDSLFDLSYPDLTFAINNEKTRPPLGTTGLPSNVTIRYHYGLMAPTNSALSEFLAEYIDGPRQWGNIVNAPANIKKIIVNTYLSANPIYVADMEKGFYNGELDIVKKDKNIDQADIVQKQFGSNTTFIGLKKAIVPRAFKSVTGPVYRQQGYSFAMLAIEQSGLLSALKRENQTYSLFVENDEELRADSSLLYIPAIRVFGVFQIGLDGSYIGRQAFPVDLRTLLLNHIGVEQPNGIARKEFIKNMAGNYLIINNETGVVSGTASTTEGYNGSVLVDVIPKQISTDADNGVTYDINDWFNFSARDIYNEISSSYPKFHALLVSSGLATPQLYRYNFLSENEFYTVFAPSGEAIDNFDFSTLTRDQLRKLLMLHFVQGKIIFTDGNVPSGYYETTRIDEKSTPFSTVSTKLYIKTGYDVINLLRKDGNNYLTVNESPKSNIILARNIGAITTPPSLFPTIVSNAVVHEIDKVLLFEELDTK